MDLRRLTYVALPLIVALSIPCATCAGPSPQEVSEFKEAENNVAKYRDEIRDPVTAENYNKQKWARFSLGTFLFQLGNSYYLGHGVDKSDDAAFKAWREAAELGNNNALFNLGYCYHAGIGVAKDETEAYGYWVLCAYDLRKYEEIDMQRPSYELLEKWRRDAEKGKSTDLVKPCRLGVSWLVNTTEDANNNAAVSEKLISTDAQQRGLKRAQEIQASLDGISEKFRSTKKDALVLQKKEFEEIKQRAAAGDNEAQYKVAQYYFIGCYNDWKFTADDVEAEKWYRAAGEGGNVEAQIWLSRKNLRENNTAEGIAWLRKASAKGSSHAHELLAGCHLNGTGVPKSIIDAFAYLNISNFIGENQPSALAEIALKMSPEEKRRGVQRTKELHVEIDGRIKHAPNTQIMIGLALQRGDKLDQYGMSSFFQVGPADPAEAVRWFQKAAEQGHPDGQYHLGRSYEAGSGVAVDKVEAVKWYRKAAEQGLAIAQFMLGHAYEIGEGVPKDEIEAYAYFNLAGATDKDARSRIASMEETMQPNIRLLAQQRTKELRKEIEGKIENLEDLRRAIEKEKQRKGI